MKCWHNMLLLIEICIVEAKETAWGDLFQWTFLVQFLIEANTVSCEVTLFTELFFCHFLSEAKETVWGRFTNLFLNIFQSDYWDCVKWLVSLNYFINNFHMRLKRQGTRHQQRCTRTICRPMKNTKNLGIIK